MDKRDDKNILTEKKMRKVLIIIILISLLFPSAMLRNEYFAPIVGWMFVAPLMVIVEADLSSIASPLELVGTIWFLIFLLSLWAGLVLVLTNKVILSRNSELFIRINRIIIPIYVINLITYGNDHFKGKYLDLGYWGYVFVIFLAGIVEIYSYINEKKGNQHE